MSYETAPATKLLATHCACCSRPLVDAVSVERGVGPDCAEKYGFADGPDGARDEANAVVFAIAARGKGAPDNLAGINKLRELGFVRLASKLANRLAVVTISETDEGFEIDTPYAMQAVAAFRQVPGRRWVADRKVNTFPTSSKRAVFDIIQRYYSGVVASGPKGLFVIPEAA